MHHAIWFAGLLGLIALAFGQGAAQWVARILLIVGGCAVAWLAFMVVTERL